MRPTLLPRDAPRSSRHDHDLAEAAAAPNLKMYRVTGAFADPSHELAFSVQLFRLAYPCHIFLLALTLGCDLGVAVSEEGGIFRSVRAFRGTLALGVLLVGRVVLARVNPVRGQRMGAWSWTVVLVLARLVNLTGYVRDPAAVCGRSQSLAATARPLVRRCGARTCGDWRI